MVLPDTVEPPHRDDQYSYDSISWSGVVWYRPEPTSVAGHQLHRVLGPVLGPGGEDDVPK